ncbi:hypothetical protein, partial [Staphylococcus aureus]|uniref:hypothetical protein n=1 Tax=Staphylococcus aureus TaxID=1280 RepID=UPI0038B3FB23
MVATPIATKAVTTSFASLENQIDSFIAVYPSFDEPLTRPFSAVCRGKCPDTRKVCFARSANEGERDWSQRHVE